MAAGATLPAEDRTYRDPVTGATIRQLTDWRAHSHHLYFTNDGLWDGLSRLLIASHRNNAENLYSIELSTGKLTQATDFQPGEHPSLLNAFINPRRDEAYLFNAGKLLAVDLRTFRQRLLYETPKGYRNGNLSCTADGATVCVNVAEDLSDRFRLDLMHGYVGFVETFEARPHCQILAVPVDGGPARLLHEDKCWIGHVNTSPTMPDALTFCHEGPWNRLQRMWALEISTGRVRQLRPQTPPEAVGHEYWFADGERVGYHGWKDPATHLFGFVRWDGSGLHEWAWSGKSMHFHGIDETLIVGDGGTGNAFVLLWRLADGRYEGPRRLALHRGSFHIQILHVHPRMFRDAAGRLKVVYTADHNGYGNVFIVDVPEFESLPKCPPPTRTK